MSLGFNASKMNIVKVFCGLVILGSAYYGVNKYVSPRYINIIGKDSRLGISFVRQLVTEDSSNSRTIMFAAKKKGKYSIELKEAAFTAKSKTFPSLDVSFEDGKETYVQYTTHINGLEPNKKYEYRVVHNDSCGSWHKLETIGKKSFTAMIFSDAQSSDGYVKWRGIAKTAWSANQEAALYLNLGDQVDCGASRWYWESWFDGLDPFGADIPMATLIGNHELYTEKYEEGYPTSHLKLFDFPAPVKKYKNQFYSFDYGDVHFVVLDTNHRDEMVKYQPYLASEQLNWLRNDLAKTKAKWKVALMHRDILMYEFTNEFKWAGTHGTFVDYSGRDFMPIFDKYGVDAVFSGHLHSYRRRTPLKYFAPAKNGTTYIMLGVSGTQEDYAKRWQRYAWDVKMSPEKPEKGNYMTLSTVDNKMILKAFLIDGKQFDEVVLEKK